MIAERILRIETEKRAPERVELQLRAEPVLTPATSLPYRKIATAATLGFLFPFLIVGLFGAIGSAIKPRQIDDPVFGRLKASRAGWLGKTTWSPTGEEIKFLIADAGRKGPGNSERQAFLDLEQHYHDLEPEIMERVGWTAGEAAEIETSGEVPEPTDSSGRPDLKELAIKAPSSDKPQVEVCFSLKGQNQLASVLLWGWKVVRVENESE